ncbi:MAG: hypothetical protein MGG11_14565 [Trichodesmium sp. MAG_R03]|nr:hypothetical protein [Trichodesmium sp. MAG_R03]
MFSTTKMTETFVMATTTENKKGEYEEQEWQELDQVSASFLSKVWEILADQGDATGSWNTLEESYTTVQEELREEFENWFEFEDLKNL